MKVNFEQRLLDYRGNTFPSPKDGRALTLKDIVLTAMDAVLKEDATATVDDKMKRDDLAGRIWRGEAAELPLEQAALIKARVNAVYPSSQLIGAAVRALESGEVDLAADVPYPEEGQVLPMLRHPASPNNGA